MAGSVRRRGKGTWEVTIDLGRDSVGSRRRRRFINVKGTKRDAERALAEAFHQRDTGISFAPGLMTVGEYLNRWLRDYAEAKVSLRTWVRYRGIVDRHLAPNLGHLRLGELRPAHIQALYGLALRDGGRVDGKSGGLSPRTVLHIHRVLRQALSWAVKWQLVTRNPADAVSPPRPNRPEMRTLNVEETERLLISAEGSPSYALVYLALTTGARKGELLALRWQDVDLDRGQMEIQRTVYQVAGSGMAFGAPKTHLSRRPVKLSVETVRVLRDHRRQQAENRLRVGPAYQDHDLIFASEIGTVLSNTGRSFPRLASKAGLEGLRFHDLRHTAATLMLREGIHPKVVQERLGHASVSLTLDVYSHVLPELESAAAETLDRVLRTPRTRNDQ